MYKGEGSEDGFFNYSMRKREMSWRSWWSRGGVA